MKGVKLSILIVFNLLSSFAMAQNNKQTATFGGGCFWCTEAIYSELKGVESVVSGYSGGQTENPTYQQVCSGLTGHAEVIQVVYDPEVISYTQLLEVFFATHDPTSLNRQGNDIGTQYRSVIFYHDEKQKEVAKEVISKLSNSDIYGDSPIVTELVAFEKFYPAENYHQDYLDNNPNNPYCRAIVVPKRDKFRKLFEDLLK